MQNASPAPVGSPSISNAGHVLRAPVRDDRRAARAVREQQLADGERGAGRRRVSASSSLSFSTQTWRRSSGSKSASSTSGPVRAGPDEALAVEREPPAAGRRGEGLGREVGAGERGDVHEAHLVRERRHVARGPRVADRDHLHVPVVAVVGDLEARGALPGT